MDDLLASLQQEYHTCSTEIAVAGKRLNFLQAKEIEKALDSVSLDRSGLAAFPFWLKIWEASVLLAHFLCHFPKNDNKKWLEIGAGMGIAVIFASAFGHRITITDYQEEALKFARANAALNGLENIQFALLDWKQPAIIDKYDYIIGSEVVYNEDLFEPLSQLFQTLLLPGGTIFLAGDRTRKSLPKLCKMLKQAFEVEKKSHTLRAQDEAYVIDLYRLCLKK